MKVTTNFNYSYCGHGIHRLFHTAPQVPHYAKVRLCAHQIYFINALKN